MQFGLPFLDQWHGGFVHLAGRGGEMDFESAWASSRHTRAAAEDNMQLAAFEGCIPVETGDSDLCRRLGEQVLLRR